jgi:hypothetical protein
MLCLSETDHVILSRLVPTAERLADAGDIAALYAWVDALTGHECALLVRWMQYRVAVSDRNAVRDERVVFSCRYTKGVDIVTPTGDSLPPP